MLKLFRSTVLLQRKQIAQVTPSGIVTQRHFQQWILTVHSSSRLFNIKLTLFKTLIVDWRVFPGIVSLVARIERQLRPTRNESALFQAILKELDTFRMLR